MTPILIAHRGLWRVRGDQNSVLSAQAAGDCGFGVEVDARLVDGELRAIHDPTGSGPALADVVECALSAGSPLVLIDTKTSDAYRATFDRFVAPDGIRGSIIIRPPDDFDASVVHLVHSAWALDQIPRYGSVMLESVPDADDDWRTAAVVATARDRGGASSVICNSPEVTGGSNLGIVSRARAWRSAWGILTDTPHEYDAIFHDLPDVFDETSVRTRLSAYNPDRTVAIAKFVARACRPELDTAATIVEMGARCGEMSWAIRQGGGFHFAIRAEEGRRRHIAGGQAAFLDTEFAEVDYETVDLDCLPGADVVICVGLLYHLSAATIGRVLKRAVLRARKIAVIETEVLDDDVDPRVQIIPTMRHVDDQGLCQTEAIPSVAWVESHFRQMGVGYRRISVADISTPASGHRYDWPIRGTGGYRQGHQRMMWIVTP